jgi:hypothetical protein
MTKELDKSKFSRLCKRVENLNQLRDDEMTRPNTKICICICINNCMDDINEELLEAGYSFNESN